jgi:DNA-binding response OmpR family regulator
MQGKILVVDDEQTARDSLADILQLEGCRVEKAANGEQALDMLRRETFDLLLLDLKMPGMDGLDVLRQAALLAPETQIILLTAHGSLESAIEALRFGAHDYLLKPCAPDVILRSVQSGLARRTELLQKRMLIEQLENSVQQLRVVEKGEAQANLSGPGIFSLGQDLFFDANRREVHWQQQVVGLTATEAKLFRVLLENRPRVIPHRELVQRVQGYDVNAWEAPEVLRPLISRLRRKLAAFAGGEDWVVNVRGLGYMFESPHC